jgi:tRNA G18 (ribose-2'-O)-methylase SpoU
MGLPHRFRRQFHNEMILSRHCPEGPHSFVLVLDHMKPTFNVGKIIRTANAFGAREVHLVGMAQFNPRPCKGTLKRTRTRSFEGFAESYAALEKEEYDFFALDTSGDRVLGECAFPERSAFVIGHEQFGLRFDPSAFPRVHRLRIPQFGEVQSLNASIAAAITAFEYLRQQRAVASTHRDVAEHGLSI